MIMLAIGSALAVLTGLIVGFRVPPFLAFVVASIVAALLLGLPPGTIISSVEKGLGDMLGAVAIILVTGAMFGRLIADSGAALRIADTLVAIAGRRYMAVALAATGFIVGIPLFYNVGFVLMVPLVFALAGKARRPAVQLGIPLLAGLSIAHGFLPPHPSPTTISAQFDAPLGVTLIYGLIVGIPTLLIAGPLFALTLRGIDAKSAVLIPEPDAAARAPSVFMSFACALLPVVLIAGCAVVQATGMPAPWADWIAVGGNPAVVMLVSLAVATIALGPLQGRLLSDVMKGHADSVRDIAGILLIIGAAGSLKEVFLAGGADETLGEFLGNSGVHPLILGWLLALLIRVALGSATVAGLTAASIAQPLVATGQVDPSLMVLAIGAGSLMCSHINDSGFWMFKEYFGLSLRETFRSWSMMETLVGLFGLGFVLILSLFISHDGFVCGRFTSCIGSLNP